MTNTRNIIELAAAARARNDEKNAKQDADSFAPIRADYDRQLAEKDAEIADLRKKNDDLTGCLVAEQEENKALKEELIALKGELAAAKQATPGKGRRK